jgi:hypothetical protein
MVPLFMDGINGRLKYGDSLKCYSGGGKLLSKTCHNILTRMKLSRMIGLCLFTRLGVLGDENKLFLLKRFIMLLSRMKMISEHFKHILIHTNSNTIKMWAMDYNIKVYNNESIKFCSSVVMVDSDDPIPDIFISKMDYMNYSFCHKSRLMLKDIGLATMWSIEYGNNNCQSQGIYLIPKDYHLLLQSHMDISLPSCINCRSIYLQSPGSSEFRVKGEYNSIIQSPISTSTFESEQILSLSVVNQLMDISLISSVYKCNNSPWKKVSFEIFNNFMECGCSMHSSCIIGFRCLFHCLLIE